MASPSYTTDLTDVTTAESTTGWSAYGGGASGLAQNPDSSMQGTYGVGKQITNADKGQYYDNGSGITLGTGDHIFQWIFCTTPGLTDTWQNKGVSILVGTASNAYCAYHVEGNDTYGAAGRVGRCYAIDYSVRSTTTSPPYRSATGSPGANPQVFGGGLVTTASVKGENCVVDACRYGTGVFMTAGELTSAGDGSDDPCNFDDMATTNDYNDGTNGYNRWGVFSKVGGGYELQGTCAIGYNNAGTETLARFEDSDRNISLVDTIHAASNFTKFLIGHASTVCNWTNINIIALGTTNPGLIEVSANDPEFTVNGGTWTGLGTIDLQASSTLTGVTMRLTDQITQNGATLDTCTVDRNINGTAVVVDDVSLITDCTFISDGTGHAADLGNITSNTTINWSNYLEGYVTGSTGDPVTTGTSGNEAILCNVSASQKLTINVGSGYSIPSVKNDGSGTVAVVAGQVTLTVLAQDVNTKAVIENARVYVTAAAGGGLSAGTVIIDKVLTNSSGLATDTRSYSGNQPITGVVRKATSSPLYKEAPISGTIDSGAGLSLTINMIPDE